MDQRLLLFEISTNQWEDLAGVHCSTEPPPPLLFNVMISTNPWEDPGGVTPVTPEYMRVSYIDDITSFHLGHLYLNDDVTDDVQMSGSAPETSIHLCRMPSVEQRPWAAPMWSRRFLYPQCHAYCLHPVEWVLIHSMALIMISYPLTPWSSITSII